MNCTVVMAVFDQRSDWLLEAINSVERNTPIILADDGSSAGGTLRILTHFEKFEEMAHIRVLRLPHRGMEPTLNDAIAAAETQYISILDTDDRRFPASLEQQCTFLDAAPDVVAVHGRFNYINADGEVIREYMIHPTPCHSSLVFRKSAWEKVGGYPTGFTFGEGDSHFIAKLEEVGRVMALPILCADRRVHPDSLSFPNQPRLQRIYREKNA